jgi:hypothetical protein
MATANNKIKVVAGRILTVSIILGAIALGSLVVYHTNYSPRTDDSEILANFIGIAPQVEGPLVRLKVHDNQFVRQGSCCSKSTTDRTGTPWKERSPNGRLSRGRSPMSGDESPLW